MRIKKYLKFINESKKFSIDERFPWSSDIESLCYSIVEKIEEIKETYNYGRHGRDCGKKGFEFNIKNYSSMDSSELSQKYGIDEEEIYSYYQQFLDDNLESGAVDIVESSGYFSDWCVAGRSGGWLVLKSESDIIEDSEESIDSILLELEYYTNGISDEELTRWNQFKQKSGKGFTFLKMADFEFEDFSDIEEAEKEAESTKDSLKNILTDAEKLDKELTGVKKRIKDFWENSEKNFDNYLSSQSDYF